MAAALLPRIGSAGPWSLEPQIGVSADYATNPELRSSAPVSEQHLAAIYSIPLHYDVDALNLTVTPSGRFSNSAGYSSLASNYTRVNGSANYGTELDVFTAQAGLARESSLYDTGQVAYGYGVGVRRDGTSAGADWIHSLTERTQFALDGSYSRVLYSQPANTTNLVDYGYFSVNPSLAYSLSERDTLKISSQLGRYKSLDGETTSDSNALQLGLVRQMTEIWSFSANLGYSRSTNRREIFFGPRFLGAFTNSQNGTVYGVDLTRTGEHLNLVASASRSLQPYGSYGLSKVDRFASSMSYTLSERWSFSASAGWVQELDPTNTGGSINVHYLNAQFKVDYHTAPQWIVSLHVSQDTRKFGPDPTGVGSTGIDLDIVRQFLRMEL